MRNAKEEVSLEDPALRYVSITVLIRLWEAEAEAVWVGEAVRFLEERMLYLGELEITKTMAMLEV